MIKRKTQARTSLGIDIGTNSIKALEVTIEQDKYNLSKFLLKEIPKEISEEKIPSFLKTILDEANFSSKDIRIALSGSNAAVRFINMPVMSSHDLKNSLKYEADKYIPYSIDEVVIDSYILSTTTEEKSQQMRVLLVAAKKDIVYKRIEVFKQLGYNVILVDIDSFAIFNAFLMHEKEVDKEKSIALLNLGFTYANIIVSKGDSPYFTRDIQIGCQDINKAIAKELNIEEDEAVKIKDSPGEKENQIDEITKSVLNNLVDEIRLSFGYYENQYGRSVDEIYVSGGLINLKGLIGYLEESFGIPPKIWDPIKHFVLAEGVDREKIENIKSFFAVSSGLVLRKDI